MMETMSQEKIEDYRRRAAKIFADGDEATEKLAYDIAKYLGHIAFGGVVIIGFEVDEQILVLTFDDEHDYFELRWWE